MSYCRPQQQLLDISYITSRILVMSYPYENISSTTTNSLLSVKDYLDSVHPCQYLVFNLTSEKYDVNVLHGQVSLDLIHCISNIQGVLKKNEPCFISLYLWQFITVWTGNTLVICCKLSLAYQIIVKAYSKP